MFKCVKEILYLIVYLMCVGICIKISKTTYIFSHTRGHVFIKLYFMLKLDRVSFSLRILLNIYLPKSGEKYENYETFSKKS